MARRATPASHPRPRLGWTDQSPSGLVCPPIPSHHPTTSTSINGKNCLSCDGTNGLTIPTHAWLGAKTIVVVAKMTVPPASSSFASLFTLFDTGATYTELLMMNLGGYTNVTFGSDFTGISGNGYSPTLDTAAHDYTFKFDALGSLPANYAMTLDGTSETVLAGGAVSRSGDVGSIGCRSTGTSVVNGLAVDIGALIVFPRLLSTGAMASLRSYLVGEYGV